MKSIINLYIAIYFIINCFNILFGQEEKLNSSSDSVFVENLLMTDSLKTDSDSLSLETDSTGMEINEITPLKANLNKIKILLKLPKVQKALIGVGIVIPVIYIISNNDKEIYKKESVGSPPQWPD
jgi:hypothetical protein